MNFMKKIFYFLAASLFSFNAFAASMTSNEAAVSDYFSHLKNDPLRLYAFLQEMPKGGDLHNHLSGAAYAENLIAYAKNDGYCVNFPDYSLTINPYCPQSQQLAFASTNNSLFRATVEHWSMLNFKPGMENQYSNEEHFFGIYPKITHIVSKHLGEVLTEVVSRAASEHETYLELMISPFDLGLVERNNDAIAKLGEEAGWNENFDKLKQTLIKKGLQNLIQKVPQQMTAAETEMKKNLHCSSSQAEPGCQLTVRYIYSIPRNLPREQLFAHMLAGFELAKLDPRFTAINLVQPEDAPIVLQDYDLQMKMIHYLHEQYPKVHISLHAGELAPDGVPPEALSFHIRHAIEMGNAERIGHGTDIAYENNAHQLLQEMARRHIMVEINLTSNAVLLGVTGNEHPLKLYLENKVPVALSTDNDGVLRTDLTREYQRAVLTYHFDYETLKRFARNSIAYSFLPGKNLWENLDNFRPVSVCADERLGNPHPSHECEKFLNHNEKAKLQWHLENQFDEFEKKIARNL
jgi:adenosine deaminase